MLACGLVGMPMGVSACGPDFPNWLLTAGERGVLVAPEGNFAFELTRIPLPPVSYRALPPEQDESYPAQSLRIDVADLKLALEKQGRSREVVARICDEHYRQRSALNEFVQAHQRWVEERPYNTDELAEGEMPEPLLNGIKTADGLPDEFAFYLEGLTAWLNPRIEDKSPARDAWLKILRLPGSERRFKSTWAAFMLGKTWEKEEPARAIEYFQQVRTLASTGFADSLGLAAASVGLEARAHLKLKHFEAAIDGYIEQMASGDASATNSLLAAAREALKAPSDSLALLAANPRAQKVITALIMSRRDYPDYESEEDKAASGQEDTAARWLAAIELAGIKDLDSAEALAIAAYRANDMKAAQGWVKKAGTSAAARWVQAKLLLRKGNSTEAAALLRGLTYVFPITVNPDLATEPVDRLEALTVWSSGYSERCSDAPRQIKGELGVLLLSRGEYTQALDCLLNAGYWMDAAYVAERVLTVDELQRYVDSFWPLVPDEKMLRDEQWCDGESCDPAWLRKHIRYLLARRLTREMKGDVARQYYPAEWASAFDALANSLRMGWNESGSISDRVNGLFSSALIMRTNGMELVGTEVAPDWHYHDGQYDCGVEQADRMKITNEWLAASKDEIERYNKHKADPEVRFHYRYQAAALAWEASKLMPDNNDQTAFVLWKAGTFLKNRDPGAADFYYKLLVNRNRRTVLGEEADRQRWFPEIDDEGRVIHVERKAPAGKSDEDPPIQEATVQDQEVSDPMPTSEQALLNAIEIIQKETNEQDQQSTGQ